MRVLIGLVGRFHAVEICLGLKSLGHNVKISTTIPNFVMKKHLDTNHVISHGILGLINHSRFFFGENVAEKINLIIHKLFTRFLINESIKYDVVITWSGCSLELYKSKKFQKKNKILKIIECGSTHIVHKTNLLEKLYIENNFKFKYDYKFFNRELEEYSLADKIFVPSNYVKNTFLKNGVSSNKIYVNPYGVDINKFYLDKTYNVQKEKIILLFCGNASLRKGFHLIIDASEYFSAMNIELWHVGMISREIKSYMKNKNLNSIKFLGQIEQKNLRRFYNLANALILPSFEEGLSLVQLQSLACGTPIISSIAAGVEDITKNTTLYLGETIKSVSKQNILNSIQLFLDNQQKIDKVAIADYCCKNFSIKSYSDRYQDFLVKNSFKNET
jgi:glycosyltransferase involved in cell wall biosynthesis